MVTLSEAQSKQTALEVTINKLKIEQQHEMLLLQEAQAKAAKKRGLQEKQNELAMMTATSHAEVRALKEQKVAHMREKQNEAIEKRETLQKQLDELVAKQGYDEEDARKRQVAINALKDQEFITEQMITNEIAKQNGLDRIGKENLDIDKDDLKRKMKLIG